jgi:tryptophan synthase alpha chain
MSRISELFKKKSQHVLNVYCTAGYPKLDDTIGVLEALQKHGADLVEIGIPYSDPLADGPVIQMSSTKALQNGMSISKLFQQLKGFRRKPSLGDLGVLLMGYMNPVLQYGFEKFCTDAAAVGIDGLILPDLPEYEFETEYGAIIKKHGLDFIFLVTPETSEDRVRKLDQLSSGFLYAVSSSSTTGRDKNITDVKTFLQKLKNLHLKNPILVGFGIKDKASFQSACEIANGAIIGTAFIRTLENADGINLATKNFMASILK